MEVEMEMATQLPSRNARIGVLQVDLIPQQIRNVKTWYVHIQVKMQPVHKKELDLLQHQSQLQQP